MPDDCVVPSVVPTVTVINTGNLASLRTFHMGDDWEIFSERLDQYLIANKVEDDRKASILITSVIEETYKPKVSLYRRRINFDILRQVTESVNEGFFKVKKAACDCDFGNLLEERVKHKFVVGIKPAPILDRLCEENPSKALKDLLDLALSKEAAIRESRGVEIHKVE